MLWKALKHPSAAFAFYAMKHKNNEKIISTIYESIMIDISNKLSKKASNKLWINNSKVSKCINKNHLQEYLDSGWVKGRIFSEEHKQKISESNKGNPQSFFNHTPEARKKIKL